ncbi:U1 small nuclear ribonucleoprotein [Blumeria graminis f. sp. tritici 96224]|uniref:Bgt-5315 n=1 Tax=Blumeria graminis f. sp. tritici 96224 TaxID=1268274 RepID=A0A061HRR4_BLUGR|nr:U1 small nuclear ribonucleoprotein [Blumeria graminis f. sp. tritici 96224]
MSSAKKVIKPEQASSAVKNINYAPNQTLYITNIPSSKIQKDDLRRTLYILFSTYGPVLDVVALRTTKMRGQAHIAFRDIETATMAMRELQGFELLGMEMKIQFAKTKSDVIAKLDGTYRMPTHAASTAGAVTITELQQSIFNAPPSTASLPPKPPGTLRPPGDSITDGAKSPNASISGRKREREEENEAEEDSEGDVSMDEDSDDE